MPAPTPVLLTNTSKQVSLLRRDGRWEKIRAIYTIVEVEIGKLIITMRMEILLQNFTGTQNNMKMIKQKLIYLMNTKAMRGNYLSWKGT